MKVCIGIMVANISKEPFLIFNIIFKRQIVSIIPLCLFVFLIFQGFMNKYVNFDHIVLKVLWHHRLADG